MSKMMGTDDLVMALDALDGSDEETADIAAEKLLMEWLRDSGNRRVADAYERTRNRIGFWYA